MNLINHSADWRTRLTQAMEGVSDEDHGRLYRHSSKWPTCACGKLDGRIERTKYGVPLDKALRDLGAQFTSDVFYKHFAKALTTLDAIEARAQELKP